MRYAWMFLVLLVVPFASANITSNLINCFPFYDDYSNYYDNVSILSRDPGVYLSGHRLYFNGSQGFASTYIQSMQASGFQNGSISAWLDFDAGSTQANVFSMANTSYAGSLAYRLVYGGSPIDRLTFSDNVGPTTVTASAVGSSIQGLTHVLVTWNASNARTYINGSLNAEYNGTWPTPRYSNFTLGTNGVSTAERFIGTMNDLCFWNYRINSSDAATIYANTGFYKVPAVALTNAIYIDIFDVDGNRVYETVTITNNGPSSEEINYTTDGFFIYPNLVEGVYTLKFENANYPQAVYTVSLASGETEYLDVFLQRDANLSVTLTIKDRALGTTIEGAAVNMTKFVDGSREVVGSRLSDATGVVQFPFTNGLRYSFNISADGFQDKSITFDPILYTTYTLYLDRSTLDFLDYGDTYIGYNPNQFPTNVNSTFTINLNSPQSSFRTYNISLVYPGGNKTFQGTTGSGEIIITTLNISGAHNGDSVNMTINYTNSFGISKGFVVLMEITNTSSQYGVFSYNKGETFGMTVFERILVATIFIIVCAGFATMVAGPGIGLLFGLILTGYFSYIGLLPIYAILLTMLAGILILMRRSDGV